MARLLIRRCMLLLVLSFSLSFSMNLAAQTGPPPDGPAVIEAAFRLPTGGRITTRPLADGDGLIAVASEDRYLYRIDRDGAVIRRDDLPGLPGPHAALGPDDTVYLGLTSGVLVAVRPGGGLLYRRRLGSPLAADPAVALDGRIFVVTTDGILRALDHHGEVLWSEELDGGPGGQPLIDERGVVYVPDGRNFLNAWLPWGVRLWRFLLAGRALTGLTGNGELKIATHEGTLAAISYEGRLVRSTVFGRGYPFIVRSGAALLLAGRGEVVAVDDEERLLWRIDTGLGAPAALFGLDSGGIVVDAGGRCLQFGAGGEELQNYSLGGPAGKPNLLPGDLLVGGGEDWNIYAASAPAPGRDRWSLPGAEAGGRWNGGYTASAADFRPWEREPDYLLLSTLLEREGEVPRAAALEIIEERTEPRGNERRYPPYYLDFASRIAVEAFSAPRIEGGRVTNDYPELRHRAVVLLAERGAWKSAETLRTIVREEWSLATVAEAMRGLGRIGADPYGRSTRTIGTMLLAGDLLGRRAELTEAGLEALYAILDYHGSAPDRALYETALGAYSVSKSSRARATALAILRYRRH